MDVYTDPMLSVKDAAQYLAVPERTLRNWSASQVIHSTEPERRGWPSLPFVAVVESFVLDRLRQMGIPTKRIKEAAQGIRTKLGDQYGLARPGLGVHGRDILIDIAGDYYRGADLQQAASEAVTNFQTVITWDGQDPRRLKLKNIGADVILDPRFGWGRPVVESNKVPVTALAGQWLGGDSLQEIAADFGMTAEEVERVVQGYLASREKAA